MREKVSLLLRTPFFWIILSAMICATLFYLGATALGGRRGVILGTTLFAQVHFLMAYTFAFPGATAMLGGKRTAALGLYVILLGLPALFYSEMLAFVSTFMGIIVVVAYFLLHYYENILFFWDRAAASFPPTRALSGTSRTLLYVLLSAVSLFVLLPSAQAFGPKFASAAIRFFYLPGAAYGATVAVILGTAFAFYVRAERKKGALAAAAFSSLAVILLVVIASRFLDFLGILYFTVLLHFFMWHIFYLWKIARGFVAPHLTGSGDPVAAFPSKFLGFAVKTPATFLLATAFFALPIALYFAFDYDGLRSTFLYHPFYGQFALFIWAIPHITLSFLPIRRSAQRNGTRA